MTEVTRRQDIEGALRALAGKTVALATVDSFNEIEIEFRDGSKLIFAANVDGGADTDDLLSVTIDIAADLDPLITGAPDARWDSLMRRLARGPQADLSPESIAALWETAARHYRSEALSLRVAVAAAREIANDVPFGHADGKVVRSRLTTEEDLIAWILRVYDLQKSLLRIQNIPGPPDSHDAEIARLRDFGERCAAIPTLSEAERRGVRVLLDATRDPHLYAGLTADASDPKQWITLTPEMSLEMFAELLKDTNVFNPGELQFSDGKLADGVDRIGAVPYPGGAREVDHVVALEMAKDVGAFVSPEPQLADGDAKGLARELSQWAGCAEDANKIVGVRASLLARAAAELHAVDDESLHKTASEVIHALDNDGGDMEGLSKETYAAIERLRAAVKRKSP